MACPRQMCNNLMFIVISISVVTSQVTDDVFGMTISDKACYGSGGSCTYNSLQCKTKQQVLISRIVYQSSTKNCQGIPTCNRFNSNGKCCTGETNFILDNKMIDNHTLNIYRACSGQEMCEVRVPHITMDSDTLTAIKVNYYCINEGNIINYCEEANYINTTVHIMYNGQRHKYVNKECYCSIHADSGIDLYSVDIRLQNQDSTSPQCTNTTLKWGYNQTEIVEKCIGSGDHSRFMKLMVAQDMWVQLSIHDKNPTMVWIVAKATRGKVNVTCEQRNVNTQVTTTTLSTTSKNTTINARTQSISSAIASKSVSTTVTGSTMSPTVSTTVQLHEPSAYTTVTAMGPHSQNLVSADDRNIGASVGSVIGIIIIAVLVVIGLIFLRKRKAKQQSSQSTTTRDYGGSTGLSKNASDNITYGYDISAYDISKPIVTPTRSTTTIGEPVALFTSLDDSCKQSDENAISDVVDDVYSEVNTKDMVSDNPSRNDNSESDYNHLHGLKACATNAHSGNVYSHFKTSLRDTSPNNDGYDHFGCNKPNSLNENKVNSLSSNDYDHMSSINMKNVTDYNHPTTTHTQQATAEDAMVNINGNRYTPGGVCAVNSSHQIEPSCEYAKVQRRKPVAVSDYEMAEILTDAEV